MNYQSRKRWKRIGICLLILIALTGNIGALAGVYYNKKSNRTVQELQEALSVYEKKIYVAVSDLHAGDILLDENVVLVTRHTDEKAEMYMSEEDIGKVLTTDVLAGSCMLKCMLTEEGESLREVVISKIDYPEYFTEGNQVDVRISYSNAEDYVVLSGKLLVYCDDREGIALRLSEAEILLLSSALHDCDTYEDTELYLVKYPEFQRMKESEVNYIPSIGILELLGRNDESEKRIRIEERLKEK